MCSMERMLSWVPMAASLIPSPPEAMGVNENKGKLGDVLSVVCCARSKENGPHCKESFRSETHGKVAAQERYNGWRQQRLVCVIDGDICEVPSLTSTPVKDGGDEPISEVKSVVPYVVSPEVFFFFALRVCHHM